MKLITSSEGLYGRIALCLKEYQEKYKVKLREEDQNVWTSALLYIRNHVFCGRDRRQCNIRCMLDYNNRELLNEVASIYFDVCYQYSKLIFVNGFCSMTGISKSTLYDWERVPTCPGSDLLKNIREESVESLENALWDGKDCRGIFAILNHFYNYSDQQESRQKF